MKLNDQALTLAAIIFDLGLPTLTLIVAYFRPKFRAKAASIVGSVTPLLAIYLFIAADHYWHDRPPGESFAFYAMWIMGFGVYILSLIIGIGFSFLRKPRSLVARFLLAGGIPAFGLLVISIVE